MQNLGDIHPNTIELANWLVHVLCDFKSAWHQEALVSLEYTMKIHLADTYAYITFLVKAFPPPFHYSLGNYIYSLLYILLSQNW